MPGKDWLLTCGTASLLAVVSAVVLRIVHDYVPVPYMDEEFHIRQARKYCGGNFSEWDPKITTPPGLYLLSIGILGPLSSVISGLDCSVLALRSMNVFFALGNFYLFYAITCTLNNTKDFSGWRCALCALNLATFPTLYFFTFLYYTDPGSVFFVLLAYLFSLQDSHWAAAIVGAASLFFRQTNIVWVAFFAAIAVKCTVQKYASKQQQRVHCSSPAYIMVFIQMLIGILKNRGKCRTIVAKSIAYECYLYGCVGLGFFFFIWINDGIVLGDRSAHKVVIHIPQFFYLLAFILFFVAPTTAGKMWQFIFKDVRSIFFNRRFLFICLVITIIALAVAFNTRAHPYLLADNRHYPFYVWRKFLGGHPALKFVPIPVYLFGIIYVFQLLSNRHDIIWALLFGLCIAANTVTQELLEFRYFIVPYLIVRLQVPIMQQPSLPLGLFVEFLMHTLINGTSLYLFLEKPFTWPDRDVLQRFMWFIKGKGRRASKAYLMSSKDDGDQLHVELRTVRCFSPMTASSPHGKDGNEMGAGGGLTDSFHGATHSERSDDPSTESRMCTEESIERMTSSTEGMVSLSDDSEDTHAEAHGVADQARAGRVAERSGPWNSCRGASAANNLEGATSSMVGAAAAAGPSSNLVARDDTIEADEQSDEQMMNGLLGSYREISLEDDDVDEHGHLKEGRLKSSGSAEAGGDTEEEVSNLSPDSVLPSPQYVDEQIEGGVIADFEVDTDVRSADMELSEVPNQRPNSLQLMSSVAGGGARSKRPPSSSSSGTSPGRLSRCHHHELSSSSRPLGERNVASSTTCAAFSTSATTVPPATMVRSSLPPGISSSSPPSVSSSSDLDGMYGALQGLQGLILREGDMVSFVAEDLQEQIRRSSPVTRRGDTPSFPGSRSSSPSLYKQAVTPQVMPIDPTILGDVEKQARAVSASVSTILENLTGTLHSVSSLTVDCMESYHDSVCKTCDSMDSNIKAMYQLMAKIEELGNMMRPVHRLSSQIKEIKRLLDLLEHVAATGGS